MHSYIDTKRDPNINNTQPFHAPVETMTPAPNPTKPETKTPTTPQASTPENIQIPRDTPLNTRLADVAE